MALPACQQRALDRMEGALRASEPHLASMYTIFGRLNAGEPIGRERLARKRLRWLQHGTAMYAIVLLPVMFAAIIVGALLGCTAGQAARFTSLTTNEQAVLPVPRALATAAGPPGAC